MTAPQPGHSSSPQVTPLWLCAGLLFAGSVLAAASGALASVPPGSPPAPEVNLQALEEAFAQVVERVCPSVVGIRAHRRYLSVVPGSEIDEAVSTCEQVVVINGSGTVVRADSSILTNEHVVRGAQRIDVVLHDHSTHVATVVAADPRTDLAVLRIDARGLLPAQVCDWSRVCRGQWGIVIGNPFGLGNDGSPSISVGVIANLGRSLPGLGELDDRLYADMIQTTAPINPGNSGGPLFNIRGELIGVVTAVHARGVDDEGVGFAIPMTSSKWRLVTQLMDGHSIEHGYLGLTVRAREPAESGVLVEQVEPDGPACKADIHVGDIITRFDGRSIDTPMQLAELVDVAPVGREVELELQRGSRAISVCAVVDRRQISRVDWMRGGAVLWRGMRLANLTVDSRARLNVDPSAMGVVVIGVAADGPAQHAGIQVGDVIERVEDAAVTQVATFLQHVGGKRGAVRLAIRARGTVSVPPEASAALGSPAP